MQEGAGHTQQSLRNRAGGQEGAGHTQQFLGNRLEDWGSCRPESHRVPSPNKKKAWPVDQRVLLAHETLSQSSNNNNNKINSI